MDVSAVRTDDITIDVGVTFAQGPGSYLYAPGSPDGLPVTITLDDDRHELVEEPRFPETADHHLAREVPRAAAGTWRGQRGDAPRRPAELRRAVLHATVDTAHHHAARELT